MALLLIPAACWSGSPVDLALIDAAALESDAQAWTILDARPRSAWETGHIPGARSFSWEDHTRTDEKGVPYRVLPPPEMAAALGAMGLDEKTPVVVYGDADASWGGEGWACWVLSWLGHKGPIRLLAGGIQAWSAKGFTLATGRENELERERERQPGAGSEPKRIERSPAGYEVELRPELYISTSELVKERTSVTIIDTRSTREWFLGHIPLAKHVSWKDFHTGEDRRPIAPDQLKKLLREKGVDASKPVVYYCTGGVRSAYAWMVHELAGLPTARNYEGGMEDWKRRYFTYNPVQGDDDPVSQPSSPK
jgi:thiosulfate/3-mercaptopyruvate sulfurtransferase